MAGALWNKKYEGSEGYEGYEGVYVGTCGYMG